MMNPTVKLYHGTSDVSAAALAANGWSPNSHPAGSHQGRPGLLYLTTTPDNALWYANEKGSECVLEIEIPIARLIVDPEDGCHDTVAEALAPNKHGLPACLATAHSIPACAFRLVDPVPAPSL